MMLRRGSLQWGEPKPWGSQKCSTYFAPQALKKEQEEIIAWSTDY